MQNVRPSILQRPVKDTSTHGGQTDNDTWVKEERRLEARRQRIANYERQFRVSHTYDATAQEKAARVVGLQNAHEMLMESRDAVKERARELDRDFAKNQLAMERAVAADEAARLQAKKKAEYEAGKLNQEIAERKRAEKVINKRRENETDNQQIQEALSHKRTFLY